MSRERSRDRGKRRKERRARELEDVDVEIYRLLSGNVVRLLALIRYSCTVLPWNESESLISHLGLGKSNEMMVRVLGNLGFRDIVIKEDSGTMIRWVISVYIS
ncbi:hypothetical protein Sjap_005030 [Stephania japonica]|uniref:Uncharacterized protein n=1 Tax=Stephania japonica TaxID=461633 RepID=A0AAP0K5K3_9MAGN